MKRIWRRALVIGTAALLAFPGLASASASVEITEDQGISWIETSIDSEADRVVIKVFAPTRKGGKRLWQTCRFNHVAPGTYRCGVDISPGSLAGKRKGAWVAKVMIDGEEAASRRFHL